jgi:uroporphyrinogen-III synthase
MSRPRVLVVRSGANPFLSLGGSEVVEVVEKISHTIQPVTPQREEPGEPVQLAVFTSQVTVERVAGDRALSTLLETVRAATRLAAVGPATAQALRSHGLEPGLTAAGSAESLLERLPKSLEGWRVLLPCGEDASEGLPEQLRHRGARLTRVVVYRKLARARDAALESEILERPFAAFCTTSPSAAEWLFAGLAESPAQRLRHTPAVVLGRFTRRFLEGRGVERIAVTGEQRFAAALRLLEQLATAPGGA